MPANAAFADGLIVLDGGLATELERRGYDISGSLWSARVLRESPEAIEQLHYDYYAAGACCAITASYQASYEGFAAVGLEEDETTALLRLSVELAKSARARYQLDHPEDRRRLYVAASIGPYGATTHDGAEYRGDYGLSVEKLLAFHSRRFGILAATGADFLACETIPLLDEARALAALLAENPRTIAWMSFTSPDGVHTSHGEPLTECARRPGQGTEPDCDRSELRQAGNRRSRDRGSQGGIEQGRRRLPELGRALGGENAGLAWFP